MTRYPLGLLVSLLLFAFTSCNADDNQNPQDNKKIITVNLLASPGREELKTRAPQLSDYIKTGIRVFRFVYYTPDAEGKRTQASGLVMIPKEGSSNLSIISFQHGTMFAKDAAPSRYNNAGSEAWLLGSTMAAMAKGYMVVMPDYLGYGQNASADHPYIHRKTLASSTIDLLRAAREFAVDSNIGLNKEIILCGYSEGGYATVATHKMMDEDFSGEFKIDRSLPGAGPYDMEATARTVLQIDKNTDPEFVLSYVWVLLTYNKVYQINEPLRNYFTTANLPAVEALQAGDINLAISLIDPNPNHVFTNEFREKVLNNVNQPIHQALQDNRIDTWAPSGKVILYHSQNDDWVFYQNSVSAVQRMKARGAGDVSLVTLAGNHKGLGASQYFSALFQQLQ